MLNNFTVDSPVPFDLSGLLHELNEINTQMVPRRRKQGEARRVFWEIGENDRSVRK